MVLRPLRPWPRCGMKPPLAGTLPRSMWAMKSLFIGGLPVPMNAPPRMPPRSWPAWCRLGILAVRMTHSWMRRRLVVALVVLHLALATRPALCVPRPAPCARLCAVACCRCGHVPYWPLPPLPRPLQWLLQGLRVWPRTRLHNWQTWREFLKSFSGHPTTKLPPGYFLMASAMAGATFSTLRPMVYPPMPNLTMAHSSSTSASLMPGAE